MRYLIVGCGRVGSTLAKLLVTDHDVIVVDENPAAFKRLGARFAGGVEVGTGIDYDVLKRAGAERADGFVAVTDGDNRNVMAALIAQRMCRIWEGILLTPRVRKIIQLAGARAGEREIEPIDLFEAIRDEGGGVAAAILLRARNSAPAGR